MKTQTKFRIALLLLLMFVAGSVAYAEEAAPPVKFSYSGNMKFYVIQYRTPGDGTDTTELPLQVQQFLTAQIGKAKGVVGFEMDPILGGNSTVGTDIKGLLEVKHAYLDLDGKLIALKAGLFTPDFLGGNVFGGNMLWEDAPGIEMAIKAGEKLTVKAIWIREGKTGITSGATPFGAVSTTDDTDYLSLDLGIKLNDNWSLRAGAAATYMQFSASPDWMGLIPQAELIGKFGNVSLGITGGYGMTVKDANGAVDISAASLNLDLSIDMKPVTINPFLYIAGKNWGYFAPKYGPYPSKTQYFWYGFPNATYRGYGYESVFDAERDGGALGVMNPGVKISLAAGAFDFYGTYAFFKGMDSAGDVIGHEIDLGAYWKVMPGVKVHFGADIFLPGEAVSGDKLGLQIFSGIHFDW